MTHAKIEQMGQCFSTNDLLSSLAYCTKLSTGCTFHMEYFHCSLQQDIDSEVNVDSFAEVARSSAGNITSQQMRRRLSITGDQQLIGDYFPGLLCTFPALNHSSGYMKFRA